MSCSEVAPVYIYAIQGTAEKPIGHFCDRHWETELLKHCGASASIGFRVIAGAGAACCWSPAPPAAPEGAPADPAA